MSTRKAFEHLTSQRGWYKLCDINPGTARSLKRHFKENKGNIRESQMEDLLKKAGYKKFPATWIIKK